MHADVGTSIDSKNDQENELENKAMNEMEEDVDSKKATKPKKEKIGFRERKVNIL